MEESFSIPPEECGDSELDPRIQLELEKLNTATTEINKLELELDESNTTFRMLLNEATRRLKALSQRLGSSVEKARPYHEAAAAAQTARAACQRAAVAYQRASEIHAAAKETVALAEQRFMSNQHEWQFDNAWQEMLNHATIKVMDAETQKAESGREHQKRALIFNTAETKLQQLDDQVKRHVIKSRPYFDEKQLCQEQLATQKSRIETLQSTISKAKFRYSQSLRTLEAISEEIHMKRKDMYGDAVGECPVGPREPGVGAERDNFTDFSLELERHDLGLASSGSSSMDGCMSDEASGLEELRRRVRRLAARPVEGGAHGDTAWETELNETVNRLDQMLMMRENQAKAKERALLTQPSTDSRNKSQNFVGNDAVSKFTHNELREISLKSSSDTQSETEGGALSSSRCEIVSRSEPSQLSVSDLFASTSAVDASRSTSQILENRQDLPSGEESLKSEDDSLTADEYDNKASIFLRMGDTVIHNNGVASQQSISVATVYSDNPIENVDSIASDDDLEQIAYFSSSESNKIKALNIEELENNKKTVECREIAALPEKLSRPMPLQLCVADLSKLQSPDVQRVAPEDKDVKITNSFPYQITFDGIPKVDISKLAVSLDSENTASNANFPATLKAIESIINRPMHEKMTSNTHDDNNISPDIKISETLKGSNEGSNVENMSVSLTTLHPETSMITPNSQNLETVERSSNFNEIAVVSDRGGQSILVLEHDPSSVGPLSTSEAEMKVASTLSDAPVDPAMSNASIVTENVVKSIGDESVM